jgi:hypothetical protein
VAQVIVEFLDLTSQNPLPAGLVVSIYPHGDAQTPGNLVSSGTLNSNGACTLALNFNTQYDAYFSGVGAPTYPYSFNLGSGQFVVGPFAQISDQQNQASGYLGLVGGAGAKTLLQWDEVSVNIGSDGTGTATVIFPEAFPTEVLHVFPCSVDDGSTDDNYASYARALSRTAQGFTMSVKSAPPNATIKIEYFAIGY